MGILLGILILAALVVVIANGVFKLIDRFKSPEESIDEDDPYIECADWSDERLVLAGQCAGDFLAEELADRLAERIHEENVREFIADADWVVVDAHDYDSGVQEEVRESSDEARCGSGLELPPEVAYPTPEELAQRVTSEEIDAGISEIAQRVQGALNAGGVSWVKFELTPEGTFATFVPASEVYEIPRGLEPQDAAPELIVVTVGEPSKFEVKTPFDAG